MKEDGKKQDHRIDIFYGENPHEIEEDLEPYEEEFSQKLVKASKTLEVLEEDVFDFSINTMNIIQKAETIQEKSASRRETLLFVLLATIILGTYFSFAFLYSINIILISQLVLFIVLPWFIIPLSLLKRRGAKEDGQ